MSFFWNKSDENSSAPEEKPNLPQVPLFPRWKAVLGMIFLFLGLGFLGVSIWLQMSPFAQSVATLLPAKNLVLVVKSPSLDMGAIARFFGYIFPEDFGKGEKEKGVAVYTIEEKPVPLFFVVTDPFHAQTWKTRLKTELPSFFCDTFEGGIFCTPNQKISFLLSDTWKTGDESLNGDPFFSVFKSSILMAEGWFFGNTKDLQLLMGNPLEEKKTTELFLSPENAKILSFFGSLFADFYSHFGGTITENGNHWAFQFPGDTSLISAALPLQSMAIPTVLLPMDTESFFSFQSGDTLLHILEESARSQNFSEALTLIAQEESLIKKNFGENLQKKRDVLPLLSGQTLLFSAPKGSGVLFSLPSETLAVEKGKVLQNALRYFLAQYIPQVVEHTLPDNTIVKELFPNPEVIEALSQQKNNKVLFSFKGNTQQSLPPLSIAQSGKNVLVAQVPESIQAFLGEGTSFASPSKNIPVEVVSSPFSQTFLSFWMRIPAEKSVSFGVGNMQEFSGAIHLIKGGIGADIFLVPRTTAEIVSPASSPTIATPVLSPAPVVSPLATSLPTSSPSLENALPSVLPSVTPTPTAEKILPEISPVPAKVLLKP
ncbi:MAG: hypothetical protein WCJ84_02695 [Candidatus Peregrinibacteria bacterium]